MNTKYRALTNACVAVVLALSAMPTSSQNIRSRIINGFEEGGLTRAFRRANVVSAESVAIGLERSSVRMLAREIGAVSARPRLAGVVASAEARLPLRGAQAGKMSVSSGSLTRRRPISLEKSAAATEKSAVKARPAARTAAGMSEAQGRELSKAELLRRQYGEHLTPQARNATGRAIYEAEQNAATARTRAEKMRALERHQLEEKQFYKQQQELKRLTSANAAKKATMAAPGGGARGRVIRQRIIEDQKQLQYVMDRHYEGGKSTANRSVFNKGEDLRELVRQAETVSPVVQQHGNSRRIVNAGRNVGVDRATGKQTPIYTVITRPGDIFHNAFPGLPGGVIDH